MLARVLLEQTRSLKNNVATFRPGLRGSTRPFPEVARALGAASVAASLSLRWGAMPIGKGDLVMFEDTLVLVVLCLDADGNWRCWSACAMSLLARLRAGRCGLPYPAFA